MKIVNILGGLGNQMFIYAMYLALKEAHPKEEIFISTRCFNGYQLHNGYELDRVFGISAPEANIFQIMKLAYPYFNYTTWRIMKHWLPKRKTMAYGTSQIPFSYSEVTREDDIFYDGYWQNEKNFISIREKILDTFRFPELEGEKNIALKNLLKKKRTVSCHIRRGDYLKEPNLCVCTPVYYIESIKKIIELVNPEQFCIFSDDIDWCKSNISSLIAGKDVVYVDWNNHENSYCDMHLMSLCNYNIIANSSFSWWGAWLNTHDDKIVICPEKWVFGPIINEPICDGWIRVSG